MAENKNTIGKDFTLKSLIGFVAAPVITRLLVSVLQTLDDSLFLSRYCGENALAAFSIALPFFMIVDAFGMTAGAVSTLCSTKMGEGKNDEANADFTTMCLVALGIGFALTLLLTFFDEPILRLLGETDLLMPYALEYMSVGRFNYPLMMTTYITSRFFVIAGKPKYAMYSSGLNISCNLLFDYIFIAKLGLGMKGAAYTNIISNFVLVVFAVIFFSDKKKEVHFAKPNKEVWPLIKKVYDYGNSNFITSISVSINSFIFNQVQMKMGGELFVAASSIVNNVQFMLMNAFFSLLGTTSPIVSYAYGEKNAKKLAKTFKQVAILIAMLFGIITIIFVFGKDFFIDLYIKDKNSLEIRELAAYGMRVAPLGFIPFGYNVMVQEFANAVGNTKTSTRLSLLENIIFQNAVVLIIPQIFGLNGIWYTFTIAEALTFIFSLSVAIKNANVYGYGKDGIATFLDK